MVQTRSSTLQARPKVRYKEIEEDEDVSESERDFIAGCSSKRSTRKKFGPWTVRVDLSQKWELDAEPLSMAQRITASKLGKDCLSRDRLLERVSKPRVRMNVRLGKLAGFKKMPVDIVYEIATYLEPPDLLHLSRTTTWLRSLFLSTKSKFLWERARNSLEMPTCPEYLTEPAYASLVFDVDCHLCGAPNIERRNLAMEMTMCRSCRAANLATGSKILDEMDIDPMDSGPHLMTFATLVPCLTRYTQQPLGLSLDISRVDTDEAIFFKPDYAEMAGRYLLLLESGDKARLVAFVQRRQEMSKRRYTLDVVIENWLSERHRNKTVVQEKIGKERRTSILEKLKKLGYSDDEFPKYGERKYSRWTGALTAPYPLKGKTWTVLLPKLKQLLEETRACRVHKAMLARRRVRYDQLRRLYANFVVEAGFAQDSSMPTIDNLLLSPNIKALIDDDDSESVSAGEWLSVMESIPSIIRHHTQSLYTTANAEVLAVMKDLVADTRSWRSMVSANEVSEYLSTIDATATTSTDSGPSRPDLCTLAYALFMVETSWSLRSLPFDHAISRARGRRGYNPWLEERDMPLWENIEFKCTKLTMGLAMALLKALGLQWETTSMKDMTKMGSCFACARCPTVSDLMDWPSLIDHFRSDFECKEQWDDLVQGQIDKPYSGRKKAYCIDFVNHHDIEDTSRTLVHPPGTVQCGFVNELGAKLDVATDRDNQAPCVFSAFKWAQCEICWRMRKYSEPITPSSLKRHIRLCHGKEPELRDAHIYRFCRPDFR